MERGSPKEIFYDNGCAFKTAFLKTFNYWSINVIYRAVYGPSGHIIIEGIHRTIKRIAARRSYSVFHRSLVQMLHQSIVLAASLSHLIRYSSTNLAF